MFRSSSATIALIAAGVVVVLLLGDAVLRAGWGEMLLLAPWVLLVAWTVYVLMYAPALSIDAEGATVQNLLRRIRVPWGRVEAVEMRWQIVVQIDDGTKVTALGGPVGGRPARRRKNDTTNDDRGSMSSASRDLDQIRDTWREATQRGATGGSVVRSWDAPALIALAILVVWAVIVVLIVSA